MEVQYIVAIVVGSLFGLLFIIGIVAYFYNKSKQKELWGSISAMYNAANLAKMDYDFGYDNETSRIVSVSRTEGQLTIEDVLYDGALSPVDEGMEEITGNYNPD